MMVPTTLFKSVRSSSHEQFVPTYMNKPVQCSELCMCDPLTDRAKSEAKYGGHGGSKLRRFQSPCAIFTIHVNMKDRVGRLRLS